VNGELRGEGHGPALLDLDPPLSDGGEDSARSSRVVGERGRDELAQRARDPFSRG